MLCGYTYLYIFSLLDSFIVVQINLGPTIFCQSSKISCKTISAYSFPWFFVSYRWISEAISGKFLRRKSNLCSAISCHGVDNTLFLFNIFVCVLVRLPCKYKPVFVLVCSYAHAKFKVRIKVLLNCTPLDILQWVLLSSQPMFISKFPATS